MVVADVDRRRQGRRRARRRRLRAARPRSPRAMAAAAAGAPPVFKDGSNVCVDADVGDAAATEAAFAARRARRRARHLGAARHRRADGAARRGRRLRCPRPAATRCTPAAATWCGRRPSSPASSASRENAVRVIARDVGGNFGTRNAFYPEFALVCWAARRRRTAGEVDLRARGSLPQRLPGPRPRGAGRAGARRRRPIPRRCAASNTSNVGAHTVSFVAAGEGRRADVERLPASRPRISAPARCSPTRRRPTPIAAPAGPRRCS